MREAITRFNLPPAWAVMRGRCTKAAHVPLEAMGRA